ncbi:UNVERIFIED_CONTAM: hypothetical protein K2H54_013899, partial [Gekko kuhli]
CLGSTVTHASMSRFHGNAQGTQKAGSPNLAQQLCPSRLPPTENSFSLSSPSDNWRLARGRLWAGSVEGCLATF